MRAETKEKLMGVNIIKGLSSKIYKSKRDLDTLCPKGYTSSIKLLFCGENNCRNQKQSAIYLFKTEACHRPDISDVRSQHPVGQTSSLKKAEIIFLLPDTFQSFMNLFKAPILISKSKF